RRERRDEGALRIRLRRLPEVAPHGTHCVPVPRGRVGSQGDRTRRARVAPTPRSDARMSDHAIDELTIEPPAHQFGPPGGHGFRVGTQTTDPTSMVGLRELLWQHGVCCIRFDAALDDDEARAVATTFGSIKDPVARTRDGELLRYGDDRQIIDAGFVLTDEL